MRGWVDGLTLFWVGFGVCYLVFYERIQYYWDTKRELDKLRRENRVNSSPDSKG
jgi:hypothetical protein